MVRDIFTVQASAHAHHAAACSLVYTTRHQPTLPLSSLWIAQRTCAHFTPEHALLCHMGLCLSEFGFESIFTSQVKSGVTASLSRIEKTRKEDSHFSISDPPPGRSEKEVDFEF
jgi:hypothetical protein